MTLDFPWHGHHPTVCTPSSNKMEKSLTEKLAQFTDILREKGISIEPDMSENPIGFDNPVSFKLIEHFTQLMSNGNSRKFKDFDYGIWGNLKEYSPSFQLKNFWEYLPQWYPDEWCFSREEGSDCSGKDNEWKVRTFLLQPEKDEIVDEKSQKRLQRALNFEQYEESMGTNFPLVTGKVIEDVGHRWPIDCAKHPVAILVLKWAGLPDQEKLLSIDEL
jgi:hypothetical protein